MADEQVSGINYFDHQFLRKEDFETAQNYHIDRLRQHNQFLHQPGVIDGLEVAGTAGTKIVTVSLGRAVDEEHREVVLRQTADATIPPLLRVQTTTGFQESEPPLIETAATLTIDLSPLPTSALAGNPAFITIRQGTKETVRSQDPGTTDRYTRLSERAIIEASTIPRSGAQLLLAQINRNADGAIVGSPDLTGRQRATARIAQDAIRAEHLADDVVSSATIAEADGTTDQDTSTGTGIKTDHLQDGAVTGAKLDEALLQSIGLGARWVRLPFLPKLLGGLPPFNLGPTHSTSESAANGIMEIPVPPGATRITRFRITGTENTGRITITLWRARINFALSDDLLIEFFDGGAPFFDNRYDIIDGALDAESEGVALQVHASGKSEISFVAARFE
jgi:hypothetical protein